MKTVRLLFFVVMCMMLCAQIGWSQNCTPTPNPSITSSFTPDSSCLGDPHNGTGLPGKDACLVACENQFANYCVSVTAGSTYLWSVTGGTIMGGQGTSCVTVLWGPAGPGTIKVIETNTNGCVGSQEKCVKIINSPVAAFSVPANVCLNTPLNFINQSLNAVSYFWNFGDGNTSTAVNPTHAYAVSGPHTVTLVAYNQCGCKDSVTKVINVSTQPGPKIDCPTTLCAYAKSCYSTTSGCPGAVYSWSVTGGTITGPSNGNSICVQWGAGPQGVISLFITGCGNVCPETTKVIIPIISSSGPITGPLVVCPNDNSVYTLPLWPGTYYSWTVTGGTINGGQNTNSISVLWPAFPGNYTIIATWNNILLGCGGKDTIQVKVRPEFSIFGPPGPFCIGDNTAFNSNGNANWTVTGGTITSGNGTSSINVLWTTGGTQTVVATPLNPNQYCNANATQTVVVVFVPPALSITGPLTVCIGGTYMYNATPSGAGYTLQWTITGGTIVGSPTANPVTVQWTGAGTISVQQVQTVPPYCMSAPINLSVTLFSVGSITGSPNACVDQTFTYTAGPPNPGTLYTWSIVNGAGNPISAGSITGGQGTNSISVLWHGPGGPAVVKLVVCNNILTLPVTINPKPTPTITMTGKVCNPGGSVLLTVNPSYASYAWSNGANTQSTTVTSSGQYCVTVTDVNGCTASVCIDVPATPGPVASISTPDPTNYCTPPAPSINVTMYALVGPGYTYQWFPGGASGSTHTVNAVGSYYVVVTDANGCSSTSNVITVTSGPCPPDTCSPQAYSLNFTYSNIGGACNNIQFNATSSNVTNLSWSFGDGGSAGNTATPSYLYPVAGYYTVKLCGQVPSVFGGFCTVCTTKPIIIPLAANFTFVGHCDTTKFTDISTFVPSTSITSWNWSFPGGTPSSSTLQTPPAVLWGSSGPHPVTLTISNGSCTSTITKTDTVPPPPSAAFTLPSSACVGMDIPMSAGAAFSWSWNFGDTATSYIQNTSHAWSTPGTYIVTLIVTNASGCVGMVQHSITINAVNPMCVINPSNPAPVCAPGSVVLTASPGISYQWFFNNAIMPGDTNQTLNATQTGSYKVIIYDVNGCPCTSQPVNVIVNPLPPAVITPTGSPNICGSGSITLSAPPGYTYLWTPGSLTTQSITLNLNTPGVYNYTVTVTDANTPPCSNTSAPFTVTVFGAPTPPTITPSGLTQLCKGGSVTLTSSSAVNNLWNTGATTQSITVSLSGVYTVTVTDPNGCTSSASITVKHFDPDFSLFPIGCDLLCDTVKIPGPIGPYIGYYTYQWLFNGVPIPPANGINDTLTPVGNGLYSLILTGPGPSFCTDTSNAYSLALKHCDSVHCQGKICGRKWNDLNNNHKFNYGTEYGIGHWRICLVKCKNNVPTADTIACTYTDSLGYYCFTNLCPGEYCIVEEHKPGWQQTWPADPPYYHIEITENQYVNGVDFGNHFQWIHIWPTPDTIGVGPDPILPNESVLPDPVPWPIVISYASDATASFVKVFEGIITPVVNPLPVCKAGYYSIRRIPVSNYVFDRIYVNGILQSDHGDSVIVNLPDSLTGVTVVFLNTSHPDTTLRFRTFTAAQLARADQAKPVKRPKPGKPIPMPNTANVIDEVIRQGGILIAGLPEQLGTNHKLKGYLNPGNQGDVFKTFNTKSVLHTGAPHGFDFDAKGNLILKRQKSMPATKHNNRFLANLLALKINIVASERGKTPVGLGDLVYLSPSGSSPWFVDGPECSVSMIAAMADSAFTNWEGLTYQEYQDLDAVVSGINNAFAGSLPFGPQDTLKWVNGGKLILTGAKALQDVPFLIKVSGITPRIIGSSTIMEQVPDEFSLDQNYPNPFNPTTMIQFTMPAQGFVTLKVYNVLGQEVATLLNHDFVEDGQQEVEFDAGKLPSGVYFYHIVAQTAGSEEDGSSGQTFMSVKKMLLIK